MYGRGYQTGGFGPAFTPPIVQQLLIANAVISVAVWLLPSQYGIALSVIPAAVWQAGWLWQPFTYMWLHGSIGHLLMNMFVLWMFGSQLAMAWGARRFLQYYLLCGVGAGFIISVFPYLLYALGMPTAITIPTVGASGAIFGVLLAYSLTWPDRTIALLFPPVAFRAIWLIPIVFALTFLFGGNNISNSGHLGGVLVGWIYLRSRGETGTLLSLRQIKYKWRRYRMRRKLRSIQYEEFERRRDDDRRMH
ncbi:MAG TPA: rhomboid family intramembrane serine protease [Candidatus Polarisedimenticolia bacterium]|nr:rhomboid family intramembrane serine protease [Candidatus Polarisedimenticolia bacterium]